MVLLFSKTSLKYLSKLEKRVRSNIVSGIEELPDKGDIQRMKGLTPHNIYGLRLGKYRVLFAREADTIKILDIDTRGDIYK